MRMLVVLVQSLCMLVKRAGAEITALATLLAAKASGTTGCFALTRTVAVDVDALVASWITVIAVKAAAAAEVELLI